MTPELLSLAEPARLKAKLPAAEIQALVLRLCDARWLTSKDLAALLSRDAENLRGRILAGLVKKGLLELRFPDVPNRPDQAYRSVSHSRTDDSSLRAATQQVRVGFFECHAGMPPRGMRAGGAGAGLTVGIVWWT